MTARADLSTVVIADDHALVRTGIKNVLAQVAQTQVVGEAENGLEAISLCKTLRPALLLLDAGMPLSRGVEVYGEVRRWSPATKVAVVTGFNAARTLADWVAAGVDGVFLKSCPPDEMARGFDLILRGETYYAQEVREILEGTSDVAGLSLREHQVLHLIAQGCSNAVMAERLSISPKTVDHHRTRLMAKLGVHSVAQLLAYALKEGLLDQNTQL